MVGLLGPLSQLTKQKPTSGQTGQTDVKYSENTYNLQLFCLCEQQRNVTKKMNSDTSNGQKFINIKCTIVY